MKRVTITIPDEMDEGTAMWLCNIKSFLTIKANMPYTKICTNFKTKLCLECRQPECDAIGIDFSLNRNKEMQQK